MCFYKYILILFVFCFSNCASFRNYISNRALDFTDVITLGGEVNTYGGSVWLWCFGGGAQIGQYGEGYGMRNGYVGHYRIGGKKKLRYTKYGNSFLIFNSQEHIPESSKTKRSINKKYEHGNFFLIIPTLNSRSRIGLSPNDNANNLPFSDKLPELCYAPVNV